MLLLRQRESFLCLECEEETEEKGCLSFISLALTLLARWKRKGRKRRNQNPFSLTAGCSPDGRRGRSCPRRSTGCFFPGKGVCMISEWKKKVSRFPPPPPTSARKKKKNATREKKTSSSLFPSLLTRGGPRPRSGSPGTRSTARRGCCGRWRTCRCRSPTTTSRRRSTF